MNITYEELLSHYEEHAAFSDKNKEINHLRFVASMALILLKQEKETNQSSSRELINAQYNIIDRQNEELCVLKEEVDKLSITFSELMENYEKIITRNTAEAHLDELVRLSQEMKLYDDDFKK